ncbi:D-alanyl-D-alanine carboxypeptidase family protein [Tissierella sp.]|uniref:D-alanyl-D-alanine carboxypeptidase family protein n=1 Tax=Tissierella sp. TaxID=41274 RepID=UPI0028B16E9A|nr:D-alanyl-D-alanine carboxypeptidase family protein [Tissierella sp.]
MKRRLVSIMLLLLISTTSIPFEAYADTDLNINGKSAILMDVNTGAIIYKLNEHDRLAPASITKIMTLLLGMEAVDSGRIKLTDKVMVSEYASKVKGSTVFLQAGETQIVEDLFKAIAIRSANDASVALAEHIAGSEDIFVKMMNEKAKTLGMENTKFHNASGMPNDNHYISAYDVALMSKELLKHEKIHQWLTTYMTEMKVGKNKSSTQVMVNTNRLIKEYDGATGVKTGSTNEAGFCLSASAKRGNLELIAVVMGVNNSKLRFDEAKRMLDYGFANYESITIGKKGDIIATLPVEKGKLKEVDLMLSKDSHILLPKGEKAELVKDIILPDIVNAPILAGDEVGELVISIDGKEADKVKLISKTNVEKANLFNMLNKTIKNYLSIR